MKYIGNYIDKIPKGLIETILDNDGDLTPVYQPEKWKGTPELDQALKEVEDAGYPDLNYYFHQYSRNTEVIKPFVNDVDQLLKSIQKEQFNESHWWIVKYNPGDMQPMHIDPHVRSMSNCFRYTMLLTDFVDGHIFTWGDKMLNNYQAGDLFLWDDYRCLHGAVNISYVPRISLQLSYYNK
jgi:hypothetical protein